MPGAVFLSYASQDVEAAQLVCDSLRAAGIEVWFDLSELAGGDAWDAKIKRQIRDCSLFLPMISEQTQQRREGYFRLEWRLADERSRAIAHGVPFLLPVVIDRTSERDALVPDSFLSVQWSRLPGGVAPPAFAHHVRALLNGESARSAPLPPPAQAGTPLPRRTHRFLLPGLLAANPDSRVALSEVWCLHGMGRDDEARALLPAYLQQLRRPFRLGFGSSWWFNPIPCDLLLGDKATAVQLLREAISQQASVTGRIVEAKGNDVSRDGYVTDFRQVLSQDLKLDPRMAPWRDDPEITALLAPAAGDRK